MSYHVGLLMAGAFFLAFAAAAVAIPAHSETVHVDGGCYEIADGDLL